MKKKIFLSFIVISFIFTIFTGSMVGVSINDSAKGSTIFLWCVLMTAWIALDAFNIRNYVKYYRYLGKESDNKEEDR